MPSALLGLLLLLQEPSPYEKQPFEVRARVWFPEVSGSTEATDNSVTGQEIDLDSDLDIEPTLGALELTFSAQVIPWVSLRFQGWIARFEGEDFADESFFFGGSFYSAGTRVDTSLDLRVGSLLVEYNLILYDTPDFRFDFGVQAGLLVMGVDLELENDTAAPAFSEQIRFTMGMPVIGLRARAGLGDWAALEVWGHGLGISGIRDTRALVIEGGVEAQVTIFGGLFVGAGWHVFFMDVDVEPRSDEDIQLDFLLSGPYVAVGYRF